MHRDHPRIRGTNYVRRFLLKNQTGSSPHTRDKPAGHSHQAQRLRIIPAYAGQTCHRGIFRNPDQDHPRIRGTNQLYDRRKARTAGSSPHTRDKQYFSLFPLSSIGIIPAYAGQTKDLVPVLSAVEDHPRIRGTNSSVSSITRMPSWIIPAYAGQTNTYLIPVKLKRDHPRIRGTNTKRSPKIKSPTADFDKIHSLLLPIHKSI